MVHRDESAVIPPFSTPTIETWSTDIIESFTLAKRLSLKSSKDGLCNTLHTYKCLLKVFHQDKCIISLQNILWRLSILRVALRMSIKVYRHEQHFGLKRASWCWDLWEMRLQRTRKFFRLYCIERNSRMKSFGKININNKYWIFKVKPVLAFISN